MQGKTVVITGATSGIGEAAAVQLARLGARIVFVGRDPARVEALLAELRTANPDAAHRAHLADLSRLSEMKRVAAEIAAAEPRVDVLVNNAGAAFLKRQITEDGLERTFALNHMAYFVVTLGLLDRLKAGARVVSTASAAHRSAKLDFAELERTQWAGERFNGPVAYGRSKLANILFTRELARRLEGSGVTATCFHPGVVATRIWNGAGWLAPVLKLAMATFVLPPEKGADTLVWLASSPDVEGRSGGYYDKRALVSPAPAARDDAKAARLWAESERIAAAGSTGTAG